MAFAEKKKLLELSPDKIVPNPAQPRLDFPQDELLQLAESIRQNGVLQPILVRRDRDRYVLVAGERRWRASRMAGLKTIPAIVQELSPQDGAGAGVSCTGTAFLSGGRFAVGALSLRSSENAVPW